MIHTDVKLLHLIIYDIGKSVLIKEFSFGDLMVSFFVKGTIVEAIVTFVLVTVILMVAIDSKSKTGLAPLLIGLALGVNILAV
jgi:glycerol uptake facilitator-like aquaporin